MASSICNAALNAGVKRRGRKPGLNSTVAQRSAANARERSRMRVLSGAFIELKGALPWVPKDTKLSKLDTLKLAAGYIAYLRRVLESPSDSEENQTEFIEGQLNSSVNFFSTLNNLSPSDIHSCDHKTIAHISSEDDAQIHFPSTSSTPLPYGKLLGVPFDFHRTPDPSSNGEISIQKMYNHSSSTMHRDGISMSDLQSSVALDKFPVPKRDNLDCFPDSLQSSWTDEMRGTEFLTNRVAEKMPSVDSHLTYLLSPAVRSLWDPNQIEFPPSDYFSTPLSNAVQFHKPDSNQTQIETINTERLLQTFGANNVEPFFMRA